VGRSGSAWDVSRLTVLDIANENESRLTLEVSGYQYPDNASGRWDRNWLVIIGRVLAAGRSWAFKDPCLTTFELSQLRRWFGAIQARNSPVKTCYFTEPNLEFSYDEASELLEGRFRLESAPPDIPPGPDRFEGVAVHFPFASSDAARVIESIDHALQRFPERASARRLIRLLARPLSGPKPLSWRR